MPGRENSDRPAGAIAYRVIRRKGFILLQRAGNALLRYDHEDYQVPWVILSKFLEGVDGSEILFFPVLLAARVSGMAIATTLDQFLLGAVALAREDSLGCSPQPLVDHRAQQSKAIKMVRSLQLGETRARISPLDCKEAKKGIRASQSVRCASGSHMLSPDS